MNVHAEASISAPFGDFFELLRTCGLKVGATEWMAFLRAMRAGVIGSTPELYALGRAILCRSEADYDAFDMAFSAAFQGAEIPQDYFDKLRDWLEDAAFPHDPDRPWTQEDRDLEALWKDFLKTLAEQQERHDGGGRWVGTGGTSPFGHSGYASQGIRVGGPGGGRRALAVAGERRWRRYRNDRQYGVRDFQVALRALRDLGREGHLELDLDETIRETGRNGGDRTGGEAGASESHPSAVVARQRGLHGAACFEGDAIVQRRRSAGECPILAGLCFPQLHLRCVVG